MKKLMKIIIITLLLFSTSICLISCFKDNNQSDNDNTPNVTDDDISAEEYTYSEDIELLINVFSDLTTKNSQEVINYKGKRKVDDSPLYPDIPGEFSDNENWKEELDGIIKEWVFTYATFYSIIQSFDYYKPYEEYNNVVYYDTSNFVTGLTIPILSVRKYSSFPNIFYINAGGQESIVGKDEKNNSFFIPITDKSFDYYIGDYNLKYENPNGLFEVINELIDYFDNNKNFSIKPIRFLKLLLIDSDIKIGEKVPYDENNKRHVILEEENPNSYMSRSSLYENFMHVYYDQKVLNDYNEYEFEIDNNVIINVKKGGFHLLEVPKGVTHISSFGINNLNYINGIFLPHSVRDLSEAALNQLPNVDYIFLKTNDRKRNIEEVVEGKDIKVLYQSEWKEKDGIIFPNNKSEKKHDHIYNTRYSYDNNSHYLTCLICGDKEEKINHNIKQTIVEATCTREGYILNKCEDCDYLTIEFIKKGNHQYGDSYQYNPSFHYHVCSICGSESEHEFHQLNDGECTICGFHVERQFEYENVQYEYDETNGSYKVTGFIDTDVTEVHILESVDEIPVSAIDVNAFDNCFNLTDIYWNIGYYKCQSALENVHWLMDIHNVTVHTRTVTTRLLYDYYTFKTNSSLFKDYRIEILVNGDEQTIDYEIIDDYTIQVSLDLKQYSFFKIAFYEDDQYLFSSRLTLIHSDTYEFMIYSPDELINKYEEDQMLKLEEEFGKQIYYFHGIISDLTLEDNMYSFKLDNLLVSKCIIDEDETLENGMYVIVDGMLETYDNMQSYKTEDYISQVLFKKELEKIRR